MNEQQRKRAQEVLRNSTEIEANGKALALLQELVDAPTPEPFGYFKAEPFGWTDCAETDDGAIALFAAQPAPSVTGEELQAAFDRGLKAGNEQKDAQQVEIHRLHDLLAAAPPAPSVPDAAQTIPSHDQITQILNGLDRCCVAESKRAFLRAWIRDWTAHKLSAAPTPAEAPADVAHELTISSLRKKLGLPEHCAERRILCAIDELIAGQSPADVARDAERLDWLLRNLPGVALRYCVGVLSDTSDGKEFREAIDAAIKRQGGE